MTSSLKGTKTELNLLKSFAGESQARNRYEFFASVAKKEGYEQIAAIFMETSIQVKEHAKRFFKFLEGGEVEITACFPAGVIGTTAENLLAAAGGEHHEHTVLYPGFAAIAREEGFEDMQRRVPDITKINKLIGFKPTYTLPEIIKDIVKANGFKEAPGVRFQPINLHSYQNFVQAMQFLYDGGNVSRETLDEAFGFNFDEELTKKIDEKGKLKESGVEEFAPKPYSPQPNKGIPQKQDQNTKETPPKEPKQQQN